jgi:hypothetical protein
MGYGGWTNCGCSTIYTDAWGRPVNGAGSGADGTPTTGTGCSPNWGLLAFAAVAAIVASHMAK